MLASTWYRTALSGALAGLAFAALHLAYEHAAGGVRAHHLLNQPGLPLISNWLELAVLPLLGGLFGARLGKLSAPDGKELPRERRHLWLALGGATVYGGLLAASFVLGATDLSAGLFFGVFLLAVALPVYRPEYVLGFVLGMSFAIGGVLPAVVASVPATLSFVLRLAARAAAAAARRLRGPTGTAG